MIGIWPGAHITPTDPGHHHLDPEVLVVRRRANVTPEQVRTRLDELAASPLSRVGSLRGGGWFELTEPPRPTGVGRPTWRGRARLHGEGLRLVLFTRVDIEITATSSRSCAIAVRPVARTPLHWGPRRLRRYLTQAPVLGDLLAATLSERRDVATLVSPTAAEPSTRGRSAA